MPEAPYIRLFDPQKATQQYPQGREDLRPKKEKELATTGDRRDGKVYFYDDEGEIILAVNVALATGRPLLVSGPSGGGKSSLAFHVARVLERRYYEFVVTARTEAQDLTWRFDAVRRLADAAVGRLTLTGKKSQSSVGGEASRSAEAILESSNRSAQYLNTIYPYIEPGELWWIYDRESALSRGREVLDPRDQPKDPANWDPAHLFGVPLDFTQELDKEQLLPELLEQFAAHGCVLSPEARVTVKQIGREWTIADAEKPYVIRRENQILEVHDSSKEGNGAVLLIDEIDKADPDVPNNLLVELGSFEFDVDLIGQRIRFQGNRNDWQQRPLIIITTNRERPLPIPFLRRCVELPIAYPRRKLLWKIAAANFVARDQAFFDRVLEALMRSRFQSPNAPTSSNPGEELVEVSIAEFVDTVRACDSLEAPCAPLSNEENKQLLASIVGKTSSGWKERDQPR